MLIKNDGTKSVDQLSVAKVVAGRLGLDVSIVLDVVEMEQKTTMNYVKRGYRVTKKNYITIEPKFKKGYKFKSAINGQNYDVPDRTGISVRIGEGFKKYVNNSSLMKNRICRFVDSK